MKLLKSNFTFYQREIKKLNDFLLKTRAKKTSEIYKLIQQQKKQIQKHYNIKEK